MRKAAALRSLKVLLCIAAILAASMLSSGIAQAEQESSSTRRPNYLSFHPFAAFVTEASRRFGVPEHWIRAVMQVESSAGKGARSSKGAMGLMQIMPETWTELRARYGFGSDPYDPHDNILAGTAYIRQLHDRYGAPGFLAAYNAGPGRYERYLTTGQPLPDETQTYIATLAPMIGGGQAAGRQRAVARSFGWANAALFAARAASTASNDRSAAARPQDRSSRCHGFADLSALIPHSGNLFVRRIGGKMSR